jgi:hypothetical protein
MAGKALSQLTSASLLELGVTQSSHQNVIMAGLEDAKRQLPSALVDQWNNYEVVHWLEQSHLSHLTSYFREHLVTGSELLTLHSHQLVG